MLSYDMYRLVFVCVLPGGGRVEMTSVGVPVAAPRKKEHLSTDLSFKLRFITVDVPHSLPHE